MEAEADRWRRIAGSDWLAVEAGRRQSWSAAELVGGEAVCGGGCLAAEAGKR